MKKKNTGIAVWMILLLLLGCLTGCRSGISQIPETSETGTAKQEEPERETVPPSSETAAPEKDWKTAARESFGVPGQDFSKGWPDFQSYEGYLDGLSIGLADGEENFPAADYDGDGKTDRLYRHLESESADLYLFSGNGETVFLGKMFSSLYEGSQSVRCADLTGDGFPEIIWITEVYGTGGSTAMARILTRTENTWRNLEFPPSLIRNGTPVPDEQAVLAITVRVEKLDETTVRVSCADLGEPAVLTVTEMGMVPLFGGGDGDTPSDTEIWSSKIEISEPDPEGKAALLVTYKLGDKFSTCTVTAELSEEDGEWVLTGFRQ